MKKTIKKAIKKGGGNGIGIGAGILTAAALAGAAAYLLSGKEGEKRRTKMKTWAVKAQKEVAKKVKESKQMGESQYKMIVDEAVKRYGSLEKVNVQELVKVAKDMKGDWEKFQEHATIMASMVQKKAGKLKKVVGTSTKVPARKSIKKSVKKKAKRSTKK